MKCLPSQTVSDLIRPRTLKQDFIRYLDEVHKMNTLRGF
jgi:hypothetical protein